MRTGTWSYDVEADCPPAEALALLGDLTRQGELHPLIVRVEELPPRPGALRSFAITDRLAWGPLRFRITYQADTLALTDSEVVTVARQRPATTIRNRTTVRPTPSGCAVSVEVELTAPTPLFGYAYREGRAAHLALAERIRDALSSQG